jgi:DNA polymerase-3 subunit delta'
MQSKQTIIGHEAQRAALARLVRNNKLPSTMLFCGPSGIGKMLVAQELTTTLLCSEAGGTYGGCGTCQRCALVRAGNHPDFHLFDASIEGTGKAEELRGLLYGLHLKPFYAGNRVIVLDRADLLTAQTTNLLLKSLEEPRPNTFFILLTPNRSQLLPTVLSRCQSYHFHALSDENIRSILATKYEEAELGALVALSNGSLAHLEHLQQEQGFWISSVKTLERIANGDAAAVHKFVAEVIKDKESLRQRINLLVLAARQQMLNAPEGEMLVRWAALITNLLACDYYLFSRNLSAQPILTYILGNLCSKRNEPAFTKSSLDATILSDFIV